MLVSAEIALSTYSVVAILVEPSRGLAVVVVGEPGNATLSGIFAVTAPTFGVIANVASAAATLVTLPLPLAMFSDEHVTYPISASAAADANVSTFGA